MNITMAKLKWTCSPSASSEPEVRPQLKATAEASTSALSEYLSSSNYNGRAGPATHWGRIAMNHNDPRCGNNFSSLRGEEPCGLVSFIRDTPNIWYRNNVTWLRSTSRIRIAMGLIWIYVDVTDPRKWLLGRLVEVFDAAEKML
jgi:hypothetical protein